SGVLTIRRQLEPRNRVLARRTGSMIRLRLLAAMAAPLLAGLAACADRPPLLEPTPTLIEPYRLGAGDQLRIVVYDQPSLTNLYDVDQSGDVAFPLIGDIHARDATAEELARR